MESGVFTISRNILCTVLFSGVPNLITRLIICFTITLAKFVLCMLSRASCETGKHEPFVSGAYRHAPRAPCRLPQGIHKVQSEKMHGTGPDPGPYALVCIYKCL